MCVCTEMAASEVSIKGYNEPSDGSRQVSDTVRSSSGAGKGNLAHFCVFFLFSGELSYLLLFCVFKAHAETALYTELWRSCAGPLVTVPKEGELVYYFPQGHIEQVCFLIPFSYHHFMGTVCPISLSITLLNMQFEGISSCVS